MEPEERSPLADLAADARRAVAEGTGFLPLLAWLARRLPGAAAIGGAASAGAEPVRLRNDPSLGFPSGDVTSVEAEGERLAITTTFLGLSGSATPLPLYLAVEALGDDPAAEARRQFLDIFHHRLLSFLARGLLERSLGLVHGGGEEDVWVRRLAALTGADLFEREAREAEPLPAWRRLRLAALLGRRARDAESVVAALRLELEEELPGALVRLHQFVPGFAPLDPERRTRLGRAGRRLGEGLAVGARLHDGAARVRVEIGPVPPQEAERLRPGAPLRRRLEALLALLLPGALVATIEVVLAEGAGGVVRLGRGGARLGRGGRLGGRRAA
jgi:type VI secretion system protein ImpH